MAPNNAKFMKKPFRPTRRYFKLGFGATLGLALLGYGLYQTSDLWRGPELHIATPTNGQTFAQNPITINGQAERIAYLWLNGQPIFTDEHGQFSQKLLLAPGYNIIKLEARDKFGRSVSRSLQLVLE